MKKIVLLSLLFSSQLFAFDIPDVEGVSKIVGEDLICEEDGKDASAMYAFDFKKGSEKVWQADVGSTEGIALNDVIVKGMRFKNCYDVKAVMPFDENIQLDVVIRQNGIDNPIKAIATIKTDNQKPIVMKFTCHEVSK